MKKHYLILLILSTVLMSSCSKYAYVHLSYPIEPEKYLPEEVNEIAVVNRSLASEEAKDTKIREAILSSEIAGADQIASDECIKGVYSAAQNWPGRMIIIPEKVRMEGTGTREVPELLNWELVSEICSKENADALLVLETFDSNTDFLKQAAVEQVASILTSGEPSTRVPNQVKMNVACYWRMYEPNTKTIIDQFQYNDYRNFNLVGGLPPPNALKETAYWAGATYINRFMPGAVKVRRQLYKKAKGPSKHAFKAGVRSTEVANWNQAIEIWSKLTDDQKRKTAGRACLNLAVAYEVLGNTEEALKWAQKSYEYYGDKLGRSYAKVLLRRKAIEGK